jgi:DNA-binding response OmpR family regulator
LPYFNGFYWCQEIRKFSEVPIIFLSSAEEKMNQIMAMNMGADDFIAKPFDLGVLVAKIQALLRRSYQYGQPVLTYQLGEVTFNPLENQLKSAVDLVTLSPTETRILAALMQKQGEIVPREEIIQALWNSDEFIDNNTLAVNMTRLRKKLQSIGIVDVIQTVKNRGYVIEKEFK